MQTEDLKIIIKGTAHSYIKTIFERNMTNEIDELTTMLTQLTLKYAAKLEKEIEQRASKELDHDALLIDRATQWVTDNRSYLADSLHIPRMIITNNPEFVARALLSRERCCSDPDCQAQAAHDRMMADLASTPLFN